MSLKPSTDPNLPVGPSVAYLVNGTTLADRDALYGIAYSPPLDVPVSVMTQADATTGQQWSAGFYGLKSAEDSSLTANNVGLYAFAAEYRDNPTGGTWGFNALASAYGENPGNVQAAEFDVNNFFADSGSTADGALNIHGISVACGGDYMPLDAIDISAVHTCFYYGIRFSEGAVFEDGAVIQSLAPDAGQVQWETFILPHYTYPTFRSYADGKMQWGDGLSAPNLNLYRGSPVAQPLISALKTDHAVVISEGTYLCNFNAAQILSFFGAGGAARQAVPAAASDPATTQALVNALRTALINYGQVA